MEENKSRPEKRVVHAYPFEIDTSDTRPIWECHERTERTTVITSGVRYGGKAEQPHFCDPDYGRDKKAEAVAEAVRLAVKRGEIDPKLFE